MDFFSKTSYKLKLLFTDPKKFFLILRNIIRVRLFPQPLPESGQRFSTDLEVMTLQKYASLAKLGVVEIGILDGGTTKEMAEKCNVPIYGIDPLIPDSMNKRLIGHEEKIKKNLAFHKDFIFIKDFSYNAVKGWNKKFDFIFIDGDHNYEAVKQDFTEWFPLLEKGGFIAFHDSAKVTSIPTDFEGWPGPVKLVLELKSNPALGFIESQDSLSVFRKV